MSPQDSQILSYLRSWKKVGENRYRQDQDEDEVYDRFTYRGFHKKGTSSYLGAQG